MSFWLAFLFVVQTHAAVSVPANEVAPQALKINLNIEKFKLPNGLTVILNPDPTVPLISYHTWFRVGSRDETPGSTGIAHLFEHLMFKGAKRYDGKTFDKLLSANGASHNAFTTPDYTAFYANIPSSKLELVMDLESDRMENLKLTEENLKSELEVVKEERRYRVENQPTGRLSELVNSTVFKVYPYRWPVIGYAQDLDHMNLTNCQKFYRTFYAPNNAVIVISGDFSVSDAKYLLQKYYGGIKSQVLPEHHYPEEPPQTSGRQARIEKNIQNEYVSLAFRTVPDGHEDSYALEVLAGLLGDGTSSRLYRKLVDQKQLATGVGVSNHGAEGPGVFQAIVSLKPGASHDDTLQALFGEIWDSRNRLYSDKELLKAKNQLMKSYVEGLKTVSGRAFSLAFNEVALGSYDYLFKDLEKYNQVTSADVKRVAAKYLDNSLRNLIVIIPTGKKQ